MASSLDKALSALQGAKRISTVAKSAADWDTYKDHTGALKDELEQAAKSGYISKQEFLERCDVRQFETERGMRQSKRHQGGRSGDGHDGTD